MVKRTAAARGQRVPQVDPDHLSQEQQRVFDRIAGTRGRVAGPFTVLLQVPALADRIQQLGAYLRFDTELERDLAEAAVLVTSRVWSCPFEWEAHEPISQRAGVPAEVVETIAGDADYSVMASRYRAVCEFTRELASSGRVSDDVYGAVAELLGVRETVELTVLVGYYTLLAMTINAHQIPSPPASDQIRVPWRERV
jgi:4-carboxymuconolactone decarboxylase